MTKKITSLVAIVCLVALCFTLFVACAGNPNKVDDYVDKLNKENNFYVITEVSNDKDMVTSEIVISLDKIQVLHSGFLDGYNPAPVVTVTPEEIKAGKLQGETDAEAEARLKKEKFDRIAFQVNDLYYQVVSDTEAFKYTKFRCWSHTKPAVDHSKDEKNPKKPTPNGIFEPELGDKMPVDKNNKPIPENKWMVEWKKEKVATTTNYLTATRTFYRDLVAKFNLKSENLVWNKDVKAFVYAEGKAPADATITDVTVTAKSGTLTISYKQNGLNYKVSLMNFGTARVSIPVLCPIFSK